MLTEPQLNIFLFILDVLTDRMCLLNNSEWSCFRTRRSAGSSAPEPAGSGQLEGEVKSHAANTIADSHTIHQ